MSTKIFKVSTKTKRDGLDYDTFFDKYCVHHPKRYFEAFELEDEEIYDINFKPHYIQSKNRGEVKYSKVCPQTPPFVSGLVIGIMNEIEKRIPPLTNLTYGCISSSTRNEIWLDSVISNCKYVKDIPFTLFEEPTWSLFRILQLFLDRLESPVFCTDLSLALNEKQFNFKLDSYPTKQCFANRTALTRYVDSSLKKMSREQVAMTSFIMQKIHKWTLMNSEYQLRARIQLKKEEIFHESINYFRLLLGPIMVGFPRSYSNLIELKKFQEGPEYKTSHEAGHIFASVICNTDFDYWHQKLIEVFSLLDTDTNFSRSSVFFQMRPSQTQKVMLHWI